MKRISTYLFLCVTAFAFCLQLGHVHGAEQLPSGWRIAAGNWRFADGALLADSMKGEARVTFGEDSWQNYEIKVTATFLKVQNDSRWLAIVFRGARDGSTPWSQFPVRLKTCNHSGSEFAVRKDSKQLGRAPAGSIC